MENHQGLENVFLVDFVKIYMHEINTYYGSNLSEEILDEEGICSGDTTVLCLVDRGEDHLPQEIRKKLIWT